MDAETFQQLIEAGCMIVTGATAITAVTKSTSLNKYLNIVLKVLNIVAGNVGKNKNKE